MGFKICFFIFSFVCFSFFALAEEESLSEEELLGLETKELQIQDTFPQYRMNFYHKSVQEEVYNEFVKEQKKENKESNNSD